MILYLEKNAQMHEIEALKNRLLQMGYESIVQIEGSTKALRILNDLPETRSIELFAALPLVEKIASSNNSSQLINPDLQQKKSVIRIKEVTIGGGEFIVMAGPCSIESKDQIIAIAASVSQQGASILRGGAFKPRTSPYDFQGVGEQGLQWMREAADTFDLLCVSEVMNTDDIDLVANYVDILQIGSRNMQNFSLLKAVGKTQKPVLLKRGLAATYKEFLSAAEYILNEGNSQIILCERGIRTFETYTRNTLDIAAVPVLRALTNLPIIVDPSHGVGLRHIVPSMANAAIAVQADGLIVEVHTDPDKSISDAQQTISTATFAQMMQSLSKIGDAVGMRVRKKQTVSLP